MIDRWTTLIVPGVGMALVVLGGLVIAQWRRQRPDLVGRVRADMYQAMFRALVVMTVGWLLWVGGTSGIVPLTHVATRLPAVALLAIGGIAFAARAGLYMLRIKPELDRIAATPVPAGGKVAETRFRLEIEEELADVQSEASHDAVLRPPCEDGGQ
jgi:hypothetical protein